ncbi:OmpA family protein [Candidatus Saccharibacteria bacterium]|nr:OmpA family protein [Candidatus Saccharibacteria bacterium]NIW80647.1 OmpA family protein [Calditrichia bacterium]
MVRNLLIPRRLSWLYVVIPCLISISSNSIFGSPPQDIKETLFKDAKEALEAARSVNADVLAPKNFSEAIKLYREAESDYEGEKNLEDIRKKLKASIAYFKKARESTKLAEVTLTDAIRARADAVHADAANHASELWKEAEEKFEEAARELEDGDVKSAKEKAGEAESRYRKAELGAIKSYYLEEARQLIAMAEDQDVEDRAPNTLQFAKDLVKKAEKELEENRYDTDSARNLAQQAKYEASHAIYLANRIEQMKNSDETIEDLLLQAERPLKNIASTIDMVAEFDEGFDPVAYEIIDYIKHQQDKVENLEQDLADRERQIDDLKARIAELEEQLGGIAQEQTALKEKIEAHERIRQQFATVEKMFTREEARVLRDENDTIIRLVGLNFAVGKSIIEPRNFSLLTKVQKAINTFPGCSITIEGHTDSYGSDAANLRLSQARADAVKEYLLANMSDLEPSKVEAVGYGENNPIANNETSAGRAKNRRIDVIIHPQILGMK